MKSHPAGRILKKPRIVIIAGVRFYSTDTGAYRTKDRTLALYHYFAGRGGVYGEQWVVTTTPHGQPYGEEIDDAWTLGEVQLHARRRHFELTPTPRRLPYEQHIQK